VLSGEKGYSNLKNPKRNQSWFVRAIQWIKLHFTSGPSKDDMRDAVCELAPKYFSEFGIRSIEAEDVPCGFGMLIRLDRCDIHIFYHKTELGIYPSQPKYRRDAQESTTPDVTICEHKPMKPDNRFSSHLDRWFQHIAKNGRRKLTGDFYKYPKRPRPKKD